jgi:hypothetical protein
MKKPGHRLTLRRSTVRVLGHSIAQVAAGKMDPPTVIIPGPSVLNSCVVLDCMSWSCYPECEQ